VTFTKYISIEGVDAVGKTTLTLELKNQLEASGKDVRVKPEFPTDSNVSAVIDEALSRSIFVSNGFAAGPAAAFFYMFYAEMVVMSELRPGEILLGDRGIDSLALYQGSAIVGNDPSQSQKVLESIEILYQTLRLPVPDCTLLLVLQPPVLSNRFAKRNRRHPTTDELEQLLRIQEGFLAASKSRPRYKIVDANLDIQGLAKMAVRDVEETPERW
jgi:thymidylate kinase